MNRPAILIITLLLILFDSSLSSAEQRILVREVPSLQCRAIEPAFEFLLNHPAFAAALLGRLYPPLRDYSVTQPSPRRIRIRDHRWGLDGEADLLLEQPGKRVYHTEVGVALSDTWQMSAPIEIVVQYQQARAGPDPLTVGRIAFFLLPPSTLPSVLAQAVAQLLVPVITRQVEAVTEGSRRGCDRIRSDPVGLYREMATWPEINQADLSAYGRLFLTPGR